MEADFSGITAGLPDSIASALSAVPSEYRHSAQEIRIRAGAPLIVSSPKGNTPFGRMLTAEDVRDCFLHLCGYAVHTHQEELRQGFFTTRDGRRVGVAGTAVITDGDVTGYRDITSLCIRVPRAIRGCSSPLLPYIDTEDGVHGLLLSGAPASGKTTVLRDTAQTLGDHRRVAVVDERRELAFGGLPMCDVLGGCPKAVGIVQAVRTLAPDVVIADEIGSEAEWEAVAYAVFCGVPVIASVHAHNAQDLLARERIRTVLQNGGFSYVAFLSPRHCRERKTTVKKAGDLFENTGSVSGSGGVCGDRAVPCAATDGQ
ncbi:MAG: stage III sporulation protein AA [Ruminococcaceae bacterium]|nr:stage III sporulation protein AA [Oscillospiraceae bacterium]